MSRIGVTEKGHPIYRLQTIGDLLSIPDSDLERLVPELIAYLKSMRSLQELIGKEDWTPPPYLDWINDGNTELNFQTPRACEPEIDG